MRAILFKNPTEYGSLMNSRLLVSLMRHIREVLPNGFLKQSKVQLALPRDIIVNRRRDGDQRQDRRGVENLRGTATC